MQQLLAQSIRWAPPSSGLAQNHVRRIILKNGFSSSIPLRRSLSYSKLDFPALDKKWQKIWAQRREGKVYAPVKRDLKGESHNGQKMYILPMFPYPSGDLHIGHLRVYTISDVLARFRRMQGYRVLHPIGWDAFGLPAENAAIERGIAPATWTRTNIERMKGQLQAMNGHWDWDREFATCDSTFYKHTQALFLKLHEEGLAYQAESMVNWDPVDSTVLANEQVDAKGISWRSGAKVERRMLRQWFFRISKFRQELLDDLEYLSVGEAWPERVLAMQKHWLGKSKGVRVKFSLTAGGGRSFAPVEVFTTRPDTIFGVQYVALAASHPIVQELATDDVDLRNFLEALKMLPPDSKLGFLLPHISAINPLAAEADITEACREPLPVYVAPYVLGDYGDGAVMGVPGHDTRDHAFWKHNRPNDEVQMVISPSLDTSYSRLGDGPFVHQGYLTCHNGKYAGLSSAEASDQVVALLENKGNGSVAESWRLRDWLISRQRYWGTPIPIIHCDSCGAVPVPNEQLPVMLPPVSGSWMKGKAGNPLDDAHDWVNLPCPRCGNPAKRDTDTMDTFVDSSWYFMRFPDPTNAASPFSKHAAEMSLPVDLYIGGVEHAILHLLYARFMTKFAARAGLWPSGSDHHGEPFKRLLTQGMVHGKTYSDPSNGRFLRPDEVDLTDASKPRVIANGQVADVSFEKMSKSKYNGVDPRKCMAKYGADTTRAHVLFQAPVSEVLEWEEERISGITRWLRRVHEHVVHSQALFWRDGSCDGENLRDRYAGWSPKSYLTRDGAITERSQADQELWRAVQGCIMSVTEAYSQTYSLNTAVSDLMGLTNAIEGAYKCTSSSDMDSRMLNRHATLALVQMMAPITPAFAEECWELLYPVSYATSEGLEKAGEEGLARCRLRRENDMPPLRAWEPVESIFNTLFPTPDGSYELLAPRTQPCAVQINGKLRIVVNIPVMDEGLAGEELKERMLEQILQTPEGKEKLQGEGRGKVDVGKARKMIVVKGGKTVNFVM